MTELLRLRAEKNLSINELGFSESQIAEIVELLNTGKISNQIAKDILPEIIGTGKSPNSVIQEKGLLQVNDSDLIESIAVRLCSENPDEVQKFKEGKDRVHGFFVGQIMKETKGKANPKLVADIVTKHLNG